MVYDMNRPMDERYVVVRPTPVRDLVDLSRQAALLLRDRGADAQDMALSDAILGASAEVATDLAEPAGV